MAFQPVPNAAEFVVRGTLYGIQVCNTFYATKAGAWGLTELQEAADAVDAWWAAEVLPALQANYIYQGVFARDLRTAVGFQASAIAGYGPGGNASAGKPNNCTIAISRRSGLAGRAARGRIYLPGMAGDMLSTENSISPTFQIAMEAAFNLLRVALDNVDWVEVIVSRTGAGASPAAAVVYTVVEYLIVDQVLDSMRRRLPFRGT